MKVILHLPAHKCYFDDYSFTTEQVERGVSLFQMVRNLCKADEKNEPEEEIVWVSETDSFVGHRCDFSGMEQAIVRNERETKRKRDPDMENRWKKNMEDDASATYKRYFDELVGYIKKLPNK